MRYTDIVFDVDGTLVDSEWAILASLQKTLEEIGREVPPVEELTFVLGITGQDALKQMGIQDVKGTFELWVEKLGQLSREQKPFAAIPDLLKDLKKEGISLGIVTSRTRTEFEEAFAGYGLRDLFGVTVCSEDTREHKPSGEPLQEYMKRRNVSPEQVLYVGDSKYDSGCARNAGADFALAVWGAKSGEEIPARYKPGNPRELYLLLMDNE